MTARGNVPKAIGRQTFLTAFRDLRRHRGDVFDCAFHETVLAQCAYQLQLRPRIARAVRAERAKLPIDTRSVGESLGKYLRNSPIS